MTNSGIGWAAPLKQPEVNKSADFKAKPYADLSQAMGESIKESIKAQQALTTHLLKNVETGQKQKNEDIKFLLELAPKALSQGVETARYIKEGNEDFKEYTTKPELLDADEIRNAGIREKGIEALKKDSSIILEKLGDNKGALNFLNLNNTKERKEILSMYLNNIKTSMYEQAESGGLEFKIEGQTWILGQEGNPPHINEEIRRRLLVSMAVNANRTVDADGNRLFSKNEILNGLIRPISDENQALFIEETNEAEAQARIDLISERREILVKGINSGDVNALPDAFAAFQLANPDSKITLPKFIESTWNDLLQLAERDPENGGADVDMLISSFNQPYEWNDGTKYESMRDAFNARFNEKGDEIYASLMGLKQAKIAERDLEFKANMSAFTNKYYSKFQAVENFEQDEQLLQEANQELNAIKENFSDYHTQINSSLGQNMKNILTYGGMINSQEAIYNKLLRQAINPNQAPLLSELENLHPYWQQQYMNTLGIDKLTPFDSQTTKKTEQYFIDHGILRPDVLDETLAVNGINIISSGDLINIKQELLNLTAIEFNSLDPNKYESKDQMMQVARKNVNKDFVDMINKVVVQKPKAEDVQALRTLINQMKVSGYGEQKTAIELTKLAAQKTKFNQTVLKYQGYQRNSQLFSSTDRLIGEEFNELDKLNEWVKSGGKTSLPRIYQSWSKASGIPVRQIAIQRAYGLRGDLLSNNNEEIPEDIQKQYDLNLKEITKSLSQDNAFVQKVNLAKTNIEANQTILNPAEDNTLSDALYHPRALSKETDVKGFSKFNFIQTSGRDTPANISELTVKELDELFEKGDYYNIGAYGIADEPTFKKIAIRLEAKGELTAGEQKFDEEMQKKFLTEALIMSSENGHQYSGVKFDTTDFSKEDLEACNLHEQFFPINKQLADYCKANNYK
tara:strand:- start:883 stop:3630 length:2748 start_codon:yes stop_codon:yes gene_type:complete